MGLINLGETIIELRKENEKLKEERDKFEKMLNEECERGYQMEGKYNDMKSERDILIDDIDWQQKNIERLEDEISQSDYVKASILGDREEYKNKIIELTEENEILRTDKYTWIEHYKQTVDEKNQDKEKVSRLEHENKALRLQANTYFDEWQEAKKELQDYQDDYEMVTTNCIYWEDKAHWLEDESSKYIDLLSEISQYIGNKPSSSTYKYFRAKLNALEIKEDE